jgi:hypothetical protein
MITADFRHRALRHHAEGIFMLERFWGPQSRSQPAASFPSASSASSTFAKTWDLYRASPIGYGAFAPSRGWGVHSRRISSSIHSRKPKGCSLQAFEDATGLQLTDRDGSLREDLPPITTFLNRLLALTIELQNTLFRVFDDLLRTRIEAPSLPASTTPASRPLQPTA